MPSDSAVRLIWLGWPCRLGAAAAPWPARAHNPAFTYAADYLSVKPVPELKTADWISLTFAQLKWAEVANGQPTHGRKKEALK